MDNATTNKFVITDPSGRVIFEGKLNGRKSTIDMSEYAKGIYYLKFSGDYLRVYKIISD
jgi:hypothetical protein